MRRGEEVLSGGEERDLELDRERLITGLVDALIGLEAGAERSFPLTLPADYQQEELRGVTVEAEARIIAVRERTLPPLDDELAKRDGNGQTVEEMRAHYRGPADRGRRPRRRGGLPFRRPQGSAGAREDRRPGGDGRA